MKQLLQLLLVSLMLCPYLTIAQTIDLQYLNPTFNSPDYDFIRLGNAQKSFAGLMHNHSSNTFGNGNDLSVFTYGNRDMTLYTGTGNLIVFPSSGGNMGIGTTSPEAKLEVNGGVSIIKPNPNSSVNYFHNYLQFKDPAHAAIVYLPGTNKELMFGFHSNGNFYWGTGREAGNNYSMVLSKSGSLQVVNNLKIGTTSLGSHRLAVEGSIGAREVKVEAGTWSDFVFEDDYDLPSLQDVETFIKAFHHLPDVPSEKEVMENGIELGKMDATLLQKIEELTLYVIDLNRKVQYLNTQNESLQKEIQYLKSEQK